MSGKIHKNAIIGQQAVNLIERITLAMGFLWTPPGPFDPGLDGHIELRDEREGSVQGRLLRVQSRARKKFGRETDDGFEYVCEASELEFWLRCDDPVLLICSHPERDEAWWVCIQQYFSEPSRRLGRRVHFDKRTMRFDVEARVALAHLAGDKSPLRRQRLEQPEALVSNLLPLASVPGRVYVTPTSCRTLSDANERYAQAEQGRASDYILRDEKLYSLRDPSSCQLDILAEGPSDEIPIAEWADGSDPERRRCMSDLLRRCLLQQLKCEMDWQPQRHLFYFRAPDPLADLRITTSSGKPRLVVRVKWDRKDPERVWFVRHQAFRPRFIEVDGRWCLEIEPDYYFSRDGEREHRFTADLMSGLKRREKHKAVLGHLRMWEDYLTRQPSLFGDEPPLLQFEPLLGFEVSTGIDDRAWDALNAAATSTAPGQESLAA